MARRFEFRGAVDGVTFVDDYAHLPSEVRAALAAARNGDGAGWWPCSNPIATRRTAELGRGVRGAFGDADKVVVTDVYGAGERRCPGSPGGWWPTPSGAPFPAMPVI